MRRQLPARDRGGAVADRGEDVATADLGVRGVVQGVEELEGVGDTVGDPFGPAVLSGMVAQYPIAVLQQRRILGQGAPFDRGVARRVPEQRQLAGSGSEHAVRRGLQATNRLFAGDAAVSGGVVRFSPDPDKPDFLVNSEVGADGRFKLSTVRTTDSQGERRHGAAAGKYRVTFTPKLGDQTSGYKAPVTLPTPVTVEAKENDLTIRLPKR